MCAVWVYGMCMCWCLQKPEENVRSSEAGVIGVYKTPHVGAGPWTPVLYKSSKHDSISPVPYRMFLATVVYRRYPKNLEHLYHKGTAL